MVLSERFAISDTATEDERTACMRLLWVMLTQNRQDKNPCVLITSATGAMDKFAEGLDTIAKQEESNLEDGVLQNYCTKFIRITE